MHTRGKQEPEAAVPNPASVTSDGISALCGIVKMDLKTRMLSRKNEAWSVIPLAVR